MCKQGDGGIILIEFLPHSNTLVCALLPLGESDDIRSRLKNGIRHGIVSDCISCREDA